MKLLVAILLSIVCASLVALGENSRNCPNTSGLFRAWHGSCGKKQRMRRVTYTNGKSDTVAGWNLKWWWIIWGQDRKIPFFLHRADNTVEIFARACFWDDKTVLLTNDLLVHTLRGFMPIRTKSTFFSLTVRTTNAWRHAGFSHCKNGFFEITTQLFWTFGREESSCDWTGTIFEGV